MALSFPEFGVMLSERAAGSRSFRPARIMRPCAPGREPSPSLPMGTPAPGPAPAGLTVAPPPAVWRDLPVWEWRRAGVDAQRHGTVVRAAAVAHALRADLGVAELSRRPNATVIASRN